MASDAVVDQLSAVLDELAHRLRRLPEGRLSDRAPAARALVQRLADAEAGVRARAAEASPDLRLVPESSMFALGDQVAVLSHDLRLACAGVGAGTRVWADGRAQPLDVALEPILAAAQDLLAAVPRL